MTNENQTSNNPADHEGIESADELLKDLIPEKNPLSEFEEETVLDFSQTENIAEQEDFIVNPSDFRDVALEVRKNKQKKTLIKAFIVVLIIGVFALGLKIFLESDKANKEITYGTPPQSSTTTNNSSSETPEDSETTTPQIEYDEKVSQFKETYGKNIPKKPIGLETTEVTEANTLLTSTGNSLFSSIGTMEKMQNCKVTAQTEFCLSTILEVDSVEYPVYYFKDIINSRFLENSTNFEEINVFGAEASAIMDINFGGKITTILAIANIDGGGFLITVAPNASEEDIELFIGTLSIIPIIY